VAPAVTDIAATAACNEAPEVLGIMLPADEGQRFEPGKLIEITYEAQHRRVLSSKCPVHKSPGPVCSLTQRCGDVEPTPDVLLGLWIDATSDRLDVSLECSVVDEKRSIPLWEWLINHASGRLHKRRVLTRPEGARGVESARGVPRS
jgi:hypothetical protein